MNNYTPKELKTYDGYQDILDNVRMIIRENAPEDSVLKLIKEINRFEDEISETLSGRELLQQSAS
tara:strand:+ start:30228 stop:30422 length:195 start_codon:yes stop_codon:yes gene_type:complete